MPEHPYNTSAPGHESPGTRCDGTHTHLELVVAGTPEAFNLQMKDWLKLQGIASNDWFFENGSGLSRNTRIDAKGLAEFLRSRGQGIVAGQAVITGSYAGVIEVPVNTDIQIDYAGLGRMNVSFTAKVAR